MGKGPKDDPRRQPDQVSHKQTDEPWKGNPEKEQRNSEARITSKNGTEPIRIDARARPASSSFPFRLALGFRGWWSRGLSC